MRKDKTEFAGNGDGRAMTLAKPSHPLRARTSSGESRTAEARELASPSETLPRQPSSRKRGTSQASVALPSRNLLPAKTSSRRKPGAETNASQSTRTIESPRTSSAAKRNGQATMSSAPKGSTPARNSAPGDPAGRASVILSSTGLARGQLVQPGGHSNAADHGNPAAGPSHAGDQPTPDTHCAYVSSPGDHHRCDAHIESVAGTLSRSGGERQDASDAHLAFALSAAIDEIREQWRRRQMWHRAEKSLTLQAKAMCRRLLAGDKKEAEVLYKSALNGKDHALAEVALLAMMPLLQARDGIEAARLQVEKRLLVLAKGLLVAPWVDGVRGFGVLSLAGIVGEAGDLGSYSNPAKLWKRMGLAVIGGERQRKKEGEAGILHGYNPARRSLMWTIGDCIIRAGGPLKELYSQRKEYETPRVKTKMHAHNRAKRYIEKRLLRDLWRAWRDATSGVLVKGRQIDDPRMVT